VQEPRRTRGEANANRRIGCGFGHEDLDVRLIEEERRWRWGTVQGKRIDPRKTENLVSSVPQGSERPPMG